MVALLSPLSIDVGRSGDILCVQMEGHGNDEYRCETRSNHGHYGIYSNNRAQHPLAKILNTTSRTSPLVVVSHRNQFIGM